MMEAELALVERLRRDPSAAALDELVRHYARRDDWRGLSDIAWRRVSLDTKRRLAWRLISHHQRPWRIQGLSFEDPDEWVDLAIDRDWQAYDDAFNMEAPPDHHCLFVHSSDAPVIMEEPVPVALVYDDDLLHAWMADCARVMLARAPLHMRSWPVFVAAQQAAKMAEARGAGEITEQEWKQPAEQGKRSGRMRLHDDIHRAHWSSAQPFIIPAYHAISREAWWFHDDVMRHMSKHGLGAWAEQRLLWRLLGGGRDRRITGHDWPVEAQ
jgi:hypothetical protein